MAPPIFKHDMKTGTNHFRCIMIVEYFMIGILRVLVLYITIFYRNKLERI
jgi:hypothetical protein